MNFQLVGDVVDYEVDIKIQFNKIVDEAYVLLNEKSCDEHSLVQSFKNIDKLLIKIEQGSTIQTVKKWVRIGNLLNKIEEKNYPVYKKIIRHPEFPIKETRRRDCQYLALNNSELFRKFYFVGFDNVIEFMRAAHNGKFTYNAFMTQYNMMKNGIDKLSEEELVHVLKKTLRFFRLEPHLNSKYFTSDDLNECIRKNKKMDSNDIEYVNQAQSRQDIDNYLITKFNNGSVLANMQSIVGSSTCMSLEKACELLIAIYNEYVQSNQIEQFRYCTIQKTLWKIVNAYYRNTNA